MEKTKAIWLGCQRCIESKPFGLKWTRKPVRTQDTFISDEDRENMKRNIEVKIDNIIMTTKLDIWRARNLSLLGKCLIVKCLGIPHLVYLASMSVIPKSYIPIITNRIFN